MGPAFTAALRGRLCKACLTIIPLVLSLQHPAAFGSSFTVYGPEIFERSPDRPVPETRAFSVYNPSVEYQVSVVNGAVDANGDHVSTVTSARVSINGQNIFLPNDFKRSVTQLSAPINLGAGNQLEVELNSAPGGFVTIEILGEDAEPPLITAYAERPPEVDDWYEAPVTVYFECEDAVSGIESCPGPVLVAEPGADQVVSGTATDNAGNVATASLSVNLRFDSDNDGVYDTDDACPGTEAGLPVGPDGCPLPIDDEDSDGVGDLADLCPYTQPGKAVDPQGCSADQRALELVIDSPQQGELVSSGSVIVTGRVTAPPNSGVVVNGIAAQLDDTGRFAVAPVPIEGSGPIAIEAVLVTSEGVVIVRSIEIYGPGTQSPLYVYPSELGGAAPFTTDFDYVYDVSSVIESLEIDFDGDGTADSTSTDPAVVFQHTYASPGTYPVTLTLNDPVLGATNASAVITVFDEAERDTLFQQIWAEMNARLLAGDIDAALEYFIPSVRDDYRQVFVALEAQMPSIIAGYSDLKKVKLGYTYAEYALNRTIDGQERLFFVYFMRDRFGIWRIYSL